MIITNCPKCGSMNITTAGVCANCGWSQFAQVTKVSTPIEDALRKRIAELEATVEVGADIANAYENRISEIVALSNETVGKLNSRIAKLEAERRWIPVSERLPETYKPVLTVDMSEATQVPVPAFYNLDTNCWYTHFEYDLWVTHWMPLPEPPIMYGKEDSEVH